MSEITTQSHSFFTSAMSHLKSQIWDLTILNWDYGGLNRLLTIIFVEKNEEAKTTFMGVRIDFWNVQFHPLNCGHSSTRNAQFELSHSAHVEGYATTLWGKVAFFKSSSIDGCKCINCFCWMYNCSMKCEIEDHKIRLMGKQKCKIWAGMYRICGFIFVLGKCCVENLKGLW